MAKKKSEQNYLGRVLSFVVWLAGVLVTLTVGFAMTRENLAIRWIPLGTTIFFGNVIIVTTIIVVILAIIRQFEIEKKKGEMTSIGKLLTFVIWLTGVLVSLAVAFGMIDGVLAIRWIPLGVTIFFGWVVVITTLLGVILAIIKQLE